MGKKIVTSIRIDEDVFKKAKDLGLNVSKVAENALKEYIRRLKGPNNPKEGGIGTVGSNMVRPPGLKPT